MSTTWIRAIIGPFLLLGWASTLSGASLTGTITGAAPDNVPNYQLALTSGANALSITLGGGFGFIGPTSPVGGTYTVSGPISGVSSWTYNGSTFPGSFPYTVFLTVSMSPFSGGTLTGSLPGGPPGTAYNYSLSNATASFTGRVEVRNSVGGACVWCDSFSGTALGGGSVIGVNQVTLPHNEFVSYTLTGASDVPEPTTMGIAGLALVLGAAALRAKRRA